MSKPFNEQAAFLIENCLDLIKQVLVKHTAAVLEEMHDQIVSRNDTIKNLTLSVEVAKKVTSELEAERDALKREYVNRCPHEWYQGRCVHCDAKAINGKPA